MDLFYENILYIKMINYIKNELKHLPFTILVVLLLYGVRVIADSYAISSLDVTFDNTGTNITATNMQNAIDEVYNRATDFSTYNTRLTGVETIVGNSTLTTTNQTLTGGINELNSNLGLPSSASGVTGADAFSKINTLNSKLAGLLYYQVGPATTDANGIVTLSKKGTGWLPIMAAVFPYYTNVAIEANDNGNIYLVPRDFAGNTIPSSLVTVGILWIKNS